MKALFLLFLVFITYSHSINIQNVPIGNSLTYLRASTNEDYFYVSIDNYYNLYLLLIDYSYSINRTYYCNTYSYPSQSSIDSCSFYSLYYDFSDSQIKSSGKSYYYKIPVLPRRSYVIIKYSGSNSYGTIKASGSYTNFLKSIKLDASSNTDITTLKNRDNYFYTYIGYHNFDYLHFYISDPNRLLENPIYYCTTYTYPESYLDCTFNILFYAERNPNNDYDYLYKVNVSAYNGCYIILKYSVSSSNGYLYVKIRSSKPLSTVAIVFIAIGSLAFVGIIIGLIVYCCKKRASRNLAYVPTQPEMIATTPIYPSMD